MADRLKRITYSIYLDPLNNPADLYVSKVLHQWADDFSRLKAGSGEENCLALLNARNVQKQVYLSGLFMHLLNPELSQQLSLQVTETQVSEFTLEKTLQGLGYNFNNPQPELLLADQSVLLEALKASICEQVTAEAERTREHISSSSASPTVAETDGIDGAVESLHEQNAKLVSMIQSQSQQIAELKELLASQTELIRTLSKGSLNIKVEQPDDDGPVIDLNERLAHVQKIKKKGIF